MSPVFVGLFCKRVLIFLGAYKLWTSHIAPFPCLMLLCPKTKRDKPCGWCVRWVCECAMNLFEDPIKYVTNMSGPNQVCDMTHIPASGCETKRDPALSAVWLHDKYRCVMTHIYTSHVIPQKFMSCTWMRFAIRMRAQHIFLFCFINECCHAHARILSRTFIFFVCKKNVLRSHTY